VRILTLFLATLLLAPGLPGAAQDMVPYTIVDGEISEPLTREPGNPGRGKQIVVDINRATCLICHSFPLPDPDHGEIGPPMAGIGTRMTPGQIRLRLVDPKAVNPDSIMPSYYRTEGLHLVLKQHEGRPIYTAQQIEDVVAYLVQLK